MKLNTDMINEILIKNGTVWNGLEFSQNDILIKDGIITKIDKLIDCSESFVFDAEGMFVSHGLIDLHTHIKHISPDSIGIEADKISYPMGTTYLVDASADHIDNYDFIKESSNISVLVTIPIVDNKADFSYFEKVVSVYQDKVIGLKVYFDKSFVNVWNTEPLKEICNFAKSNRLFVMVHSTNSPVSMTEIVDALNAGDIISHAFHGGDNNASDNCFESMKKAKEKGIYTDAALSAYYHINFSVFEQAAKNGVYPDIISSDITKELEYVSDVKYGLPVCMSILQNLGMDITSIFKAVTINPAGILKNSNNNGCLNVGDIADIAIFRNEKGIIRLTDTSGNIIELNEYLKCALTMCNGKVIYFEN